MQAQSDHCKLLAVRIQPNIMSLPLIVEPLLTHTTYSQTQHLKNSEAAAPGFQGPWHVEHVADTG